MSDTATEVDDLKAIRENAKGLIRKMFSLDVALDSSVCKEYLEKHPACNDCHSYHGCALVLNILNWVSEVFPDRYCKENMQSYVKGLYDGYSFVITGKPRIIPL